MKKSRIWFYKPRAIFSLNPFKIGGDEFNRCTIVIGFPWSGRVIIPISRHGCVHKDGDTTFISLVQDDVNEEWETEVDVGYGVVLSIRSDTGKVHSIEVEN